MPEKMYTTGEAAKLLGVNVKTVLRLCISGDITAHRISSHGQWRITRTVLVEYARRHGIPLQEDSNGN